MEATFCIGTERTINELTVVTIEFQDVETKKVYPLANPYVKILTKQTNALESTYTVMIFKKSLILWLKGYTSSRGVTKRIPPFGIKIDDSSPLVKLSYKDFFVAVRGKPSVVPKDSGVEKTVLGPPIIPKSKKAVKLIKKGGSNVRTEKSKD